MIFIRCEPPFGFFRYQTGPQSKCSVVKDSLGCGCAALCSSAANLGSWWTTYPTTAPAFVNAASNSSLLKSVLIKSSCRAPALRAMAFQPFCVGTVMCTRTFPRASRTGRMTPGIIERMAGLEWSKVSRMPYAENGCRPAAAHRNQ